MTLFDLAAKLGLDTDEFEKGINNAERSGKSLGEKLSSSFDKIKKVAAVALSGAVIKKGIDTVMNLAKATSDAGDKIDKQSQALGLSRKAYQEWDYILGQNGASIDSLGVSMKTLNGLVLDAAAGGKESKIAFSKLGVSIHELETLNMEDQFEAVVRAFQKMPAGAKKSALAVQIFGRNGMELLPLLNQADTSIDELRKRAEELGIIMSDDAVDASVAYNDAMDDLNRTINGLKYSFGAKLLPTFTAGINKMAGYVGKMSNAFQERGFKGVWDTLVSDFKNIKWPTWSDVKNAAVTAWDTVVTGVKNLTKLVFGTKADGSVNWPTWDDVKTAAETAWGTIKDGALEIADIAGELVFGRKEDGSVNWPTWEDVKAKANEIWNSIKASATELGGVIFGTKADGSVNWPTWEDVKAKATEVWNDIKAKAKSIADTAGALVFGKNEDGTVAWPTWDDVEAKATEVWNAIKAKALDLAGLVFGKKEDGSVNFPTWEDVKTKATEAWNAIKVKALGLAGLVFGKKEDGTVDWPTWEQVETKATEVWNTIKAKALTLAGLVFGKKEDGSVDFPTWEDVKTKAEEVWGAIKDEALNLAGLVFGKKENGSVNWPTWDDVKDAASEAWETIKNGVDGLGKVVFGTNVDGTIKWPTWEEIQGELTTAWNGIVDGVKNLTKVVFGEDVTISPVLQNALSFIQDVGNWVIQNADAVVQGLGAVLGVFALKNLAGLAMVNPLLTGIAVGAAFVIANWDKVKEVVGEVQQKVEEFKKSLEPINNWFLQLQGGGNGTLVQGQITDLTTDYRKVKAIEKRRGEKAGQESFENFKKNFARELREAGISADAAEEAVAKIDLSWTVEQMDAYINSFTNASAAVSALKEQVDGLAGDYDINFNINTYGEMPNPGQSSSGPKRNRTVTGTASGDSMEGHHAKGLWDVPYDGYIAELHRGETVLNASRARDYRQGGSSGVDVSALVSAISESIKSSMRDVTVKSYLSGRDVTDDVNRNTVRQLKARRFAT